MLFILFLTDTYGEGYYHGAFFSGLYSFSIGCIFCYIYLKNKNFFKSKIFNIFYFIFLFIFLAELFGYKILYEYDYIFLYSIFFGLMIYFSCFLNKTYFLYKILFNNFFIFLGKISYSIYLGHLLVFYVMNNFLRFIVQYPTETTLDGKIILKLSVLEANSFTLLAYILTILFASFTYKYVENKFYKKI